MGGRREGSEDRKLHSVSMRLHTRPPATLLVAVLTLGLTGCVSETPEPSRATSTPSSHTPVAEASDIDDDASNAQVCSDFHVALDDYGDSLSAGPESPIDEWVDAYAELSFSARDLARDATPGSDVEGALLALSSQLAASADELESTGKNSTVQTVELVSAFNDAVDACGLNIEISD